MDPNGKEVIPRPSIQIRFKKRVFLFLVRFYLFPQIKFIMLLHVGLYGLKFLYRFSLCHSAGTLPVARTDSSPKWCTSSYVSAVLIILRPISSKAARSSALSCTSGCSSCHALLQFLKASSHLRTGQQFRSGEKCRAKTVCSSQFPTSSTFYNSNCS